MARWAQTPPSARRVKFVLAIAVLCIALFAVEYYFGWPEALSTDPRGRLWRP